MSAAFYASLRGEGWSRDCPKCVASKFTCDGHNPNAKIYLGWEIDRDFLGHWRAVHPSFDGESNTVQLTALTRRDLIAEIDLWIEENEVRS